MVKIEHDAAEALILFSEQIFNGNLDILHDDISCACSGRVAGLDNFRGQTYFCKKRRRKKNYVSEKYVVLKIVKINPTFTALNEEQGNAIQAATTSTNGSDEIVTECSVGDPLLGA
jgi:hypothetical protein